MKTNQFLSDLNNIAAHDSSIAKINLAVSANIDGLSVSDMSETFGRVINRIVSDKSVMLDGMRHSDLAVFSRFDKAIQRHNVMVLWQSARQHFQTDGETSRFLSHVQYSKKDGYHFTVKASKVEVKGYSTFDAANGQRLILSAKAKADNIEVSIETLSIPMDLLIADYQTWIDSLKDFVAVELNDDNHTVPDVTLETSGDSSLLKQVNVLQSQHAIDLYQLQSVQVENNALIQQIAELQKQVDHYRDLYNIASGLLTLPKVKAKKRA